MNSPRQPLSALLLCGLLLLIPNVLAYAGSATWNLNPTNGDWNTAANWTPATVPNGPGDIATFDVSNITKVSVSADIEVDSILFDPGASALTVSLPVEATLNLSGAGLTNNSATMQNFVTGPTADGEPSATVQFSFHASAGSLVSVTNNGGMDGGDGGRTNFLHNATAGSATFINNGSTFDASSGWTQFFDQSSAGEGTFIVNGSGSDFGHGGRTLFMDSATAGNGTFIVNGMTVEAFGATVEFTDNSSAGSGTFTINGGSDSLIGMGSVFFQDTSSADEGIFTVNDEAYISFIGRLGSTAGNATLIANGGPTRGGIIQFTDVSTGGTARVEVFDNGSLNINDNYEEPSLTIGSLEGDGRVRLTGHLLNVGANNLSTIFSGVISNRRGSLGKVGTGTLTLSGTNTYGGGTTISAGVLEVNTASGSGTGTGPVNVLAGTISGRGIIAGPTTIGTGTGGGAFLQPGKGARRRLLSPPKAASPSKATAPILGK